MSKRFGSHTTVQLIKEIQDLQDRWESANSRLQSTLGEVKKAEGNLRAVEDDLGEAIRLFTERLPELLRKKMLDWLASNGAERYSSPPEARGAFEGADGADHHE